MDYFSTLIIAVTSRFGLFASVAVANSLFVYVLPVVLGVPQLEIVTLSIAMVMIWNIKYIVAFFFPNESVLEQRLIRVTVAAAVVLSCVGAIFANIVTDVLAL